MTISEKQKYSLQKYVLSSPKLVLGLIVGLLYLCID